MEMVTEYPSKSWVGSLCHCGLGRPHAGHCPWWLGGVNRNASRWTLDICQGPCHLELGTPSQQKLQEPISVDGGTSYRCTLHGYHLTLSLTVTCMGKCTRRYAGLKTVDYNLHYGYVCNMFNICSVVQFQCRCHSKRCRNQWNLRRFTCKPTFNLNFWNSVRHSADLLFASLVYSGIKWVWAPAICMLDKHWLLTPSTHLSAYCLYS